MYPILKGLAATCLLFLSDLQKLFLLAQINDQSGGGGRMMEYHGYGLRLGWWTLIILFWVLVVVGVIASLRWAIEGSRRDRGTRNEPALPPRNRALEILNERYAKGEIDKHEYEEKKRDILSS